MLMFQQKNQKELQEALGELFNDISEGAAEIGRVYSFREIAADGFEEMDGQTLEQFLYDSYFADMFRHMRFAETNPYRKAAERRLNYFVQHGAVEVGEDVRIVDYNKFKAAVSDLYALHLELMQTGDTAKAQKFMETYAISANSPLGEQKQNLIERINSKGIPRDIVMRYAV